MEFWFSIIDLYRIGDKLFTGTVRIERGVDICFYVNRDYNFLVPFEYFPIELDNRNPLGKDFPGNSWSIVYRLSFRNEHGREDSHGRVVH